MKNLLFLAFAVLLLLSANASAEIKLKSLAKKKWTLVESDNFKIITDLSEKRAKIASEQLERYRAFCVLWLNAKPSENQSKMVMFLTRRSGTWTAMGLNKNYVSLYSRRKGISTQMFVNVKGLFGRSFRKPDSGRAVVLNSIAQEMLSSVGIDRNYPLWFRFGFSYYLGTYTEPDDKIILGNVAAYNDRLSAIFTGAGYISNFDSKSLFSRKKMSMQLNGRSRERMLRDVNRFYMKSFLTVHYLYSSNELRQQMFNYIELIVSGKSEEDAANIAFSKSFEELDKDLRKYAGGSSLTARVMQKQQIQPLLTLSKSYKVSSIDDTQFFEYYTKALLELGENSIANSDKQAFFKEYKKRYLADKVSETKL